MEYILLGTTAISASNYINTPKKAKKYVFPCLNNRVLPNGLHKVPVLVEPGLILLIVWLQLQQLAEKVASSFERLHLLLKGYIFF